MNISVFRAAGLVLLLGVFHTHVWAQQRSVSFTAGQLEKNMAREYPVERSFQDVTATISDPKAILDPLEDTLEVRLKIHARLGDNSLLATGQFVGNMKYDAPFKLLRIEHPKLDTFEVEDSGNLSDEQQKHVIRVIKQSLLGNLPPLVVVDMNKMDLQMPRQAPERIDVELDRLTLEFK